MSRPITVVLFLFATLSAFAGDPWDGAPFSSDPKALLAAAEAVKPEKPEEGVIVLLDEARVTFDAQGRSTRVDRLIYRVYDESAVEGWAEIETSWSPWYHERPQVDARVIAKDGTVHRLDPKSFGTEDAEDDQDMFSDTRILSGPLPAVAPGSVIEQTITYREKNPLYDAGAAERHQFGRWVESRQSRLVIEHPSALALRLTNKTKPAVPPQKSERDGIVRIVFETGPMKAFDTREWNLPGDVSIDSYVAWATGKSWQDVATRYAQIVDEKIGDLSTVAKLTATAVGDAKDPREIASRILATVERHIRYAGVEFGEGSIIPRAPSETLKNKYGDCKDKAILLAGMLRQAGVPAHVALLRSGAGYDVERDLPGLGYFNHVIVVTDGADPIWIDPTDEFARAGELPDSDQGRLALIARSETTDLTLTPQYDAAANRAVELREFHLAEDGKATVSETSTYFGSDERYMRRYYTENDQKQIGDELKNYAENAYLAKSLAKWNSNDTHDLTKPFELRLEMNEATRGLTAGGEAAVGIFFSRMTANLPADLHRDAESEKEEDEEEKYKPRQNDYLFWKPFTLELHYRIHPPPGYELRVKPENETLPLGTATITKQYTVQDDGIVLADFKFESGPRRITPAQFEELRKAVVKLDKEPAYLLTFDQIGRKHLDAGDVGKAVAEFRRIAQLHPREALHHTDIAKALLAGGMGAAARREAKLATEIEPKSARAWATLGLILVHDLIGREFHPGCDRKASIDAYRKAKALAPTEVPIRGELATVLLHGDDGTRYGNGAPLNEAIDEYLALKKDIKEVNLEAIDRELMALYAMTNRWSDLEKLLAETTDRDKKDLYKVIAAGGAKDGAAAIAASAALDAAKRRETQVAAGSTLASMRIYAPAADLLAEAAQGSNNASQLRMQADVMRKAVRFETLKLGRDDPQSLLKALLIEFFNGKSEKELDSYATKDLRVLFEDDGLSSKELAKDAKRRTAKKAWKKNSESKFLADVGLAAIQIQQDGDEAIGYRLRGRAPNAGSLLTAYVVKEEGEFRVAGFDGNPSMLALRALRLADGDDLVAARHWLDWARDHVNSKYSEDPLSSHPFTAFWTRGKEGQRDEIRLAAATLLPDTKKSSELALPILKAARETATPELQSRIDQAISNAYLSLENWSELLVVNERLAAKFPESMSAFLNVVIALTQLERFDEIRTRALARLEQTPGDTGALQVLGNHSLEHGKYGEAMGYFAGLLERANAEPGDYNNHAWASIFANLDLDKAIEEAQHATSAAPESYPILNTLAVLYAERGRSTEARETLLKSLEKKDEDALHGSDWYVIGRIAENYGIADAAIEAYQRIEKPKQAQGTTYELAQKRLAGLKR